MIENLIIAKSFDEIYDLLKSSVKNSAASLMSSRNDFEESISLHLKEVSNWSGEVNFKDLNRARRTTDIYIDLDLYATPRRSRYGNENIPKVPLIKIILENDFHIILLGQPGAGKTTSMKKICQILFTEEKFDTNSASFPILIKLREINKSASELSDSIIINILYNILGIQLEIRENALNTPDMLLSLKTRLVVQTLNSLGALLIIEGFDELINEDSRSTVIEDIRKLALLLDNSRLVVTSRTGDFDYQIDGATQFEISPLSNEQVVAFSRKWLSSEEKATQFVKDVYSTPYVDTALRPLTLSHLCAIYARTNKIPDKPKTIYKRVISLLLEEWDEQRSIERVSKYASFEIDRKFEFLSQLSYILTSKLKKTVFTSDDFLNAYNVIYTDFDLKQREARLVVNELESHTGLFLQSGIDQYEFAHKSLQEYLAAEYIVKLPTVPYSMDGIFELPNEMAIAVAISSKPSDYLAEFVLRRLSAAPRNVPQGFIHAFITRLFLEKPNFNSTNLLGFSLIYIYSISLQRQKTQRSDKAKEQFGEMLKRVITKNMIQYVKGFYDYKSEGRSKTLIELRKKKEGEYGFTFPDELTIKRDLWDLC